MSTLLVYKLYIHLWLTHMHWLGSWLNPLTFASWPKETAFKRMP